MAKEYDPVYFAVRFFVRNFIFGPFGGINALHEERVPREGAVILAANHVSFADPAAVACATRRRLRFMAKSDLFRVFAFGSLIARVGAFPVHRGEADTEAIKKTLRFLEQGEAVLLFPEGGRGDGKKLQPANKGVTLLARKSGAKVLPIGICDTDKWLPLGSKFPKRVRVTVVFGEAFTYSDVEDRLGADAKEKFGDLLMEKIAGLMEEGGRRILVS